MPSALIGLILTGGRSSRMGTDKSLLTYEGIPQWRRVGQLLRPFTRKIVISCQPSQASQYNEFDLLPDAEEFKDTGPVAGILTAFGRFPDHALLVVGCDYPFLSAREIQPLIEATKDPAKTVCYHHSETSWDEPFPAIYDYSIYRLMLKEFGEGHFSLRQLLRIASPTRLKPANPQALKSVNTTEEYEWARGMLR